MSAPPYAPEFSLRIAGAPVPAELRACVSAVSLQSSLDAVDRVDLTLANDRLRWLDDPLFALDNELALSIGYAPDLLEQVFVGQIVGHGARFDASLPSFTVAAQDRRTQMQRGTRTRWFAIPAGDSLLPLPDDDVAGVVSLEHGLVPSIDAVAATLSLILNAADVAASLVSGGEAQDAVRRQIRESDFNFLAGLCSENGWEMIVDHSEPAAGRTLRFFSPLGHLSADLTLGWGHSLLSFEPRISTVGQIASVTGYVWIPKIKTELAVTLGWDWDRNELTIEIQPNVQPLPSGTGSDQPGDQLVKKVLSPLTAAHELVSVLIPKLNSRLVASGSTIGDLRIRPGAVVRIEGVGVEFGGLYRVTSASHTIDAGGYRTSFEARREIWFGSIPSAAQGALPIPAPVAVQV